MANIFKREPKKAPQPEIKGTALVGAIIVGVTAVELTKGAVKFVGRQARKLLSKATPDPLEITFAPEAEVEIDGNKA